MCDVQHIRIPYSESHSQADLSRTTLLDIVPNKWRNVKGLHCTKQNEVIHYVPQTEKMTCSSSCQNWGGFFCCCWTTFWPGISLGNYQDLLLCLSRSFAFFHCRTAFNYLTHRESPFTEIMRGRPKASKNPHYTVTKQANSALHPFILPPYVLLKER